MWLFTHDRSKPWEENQHCIYTFNSVEEFWGLYHNIALPSELPSGCDYSLFKVSVTTNDLLMYKYKGSTCIFDKYIVRITAQTYYPIISVMVLGRHQANVGGRKE